MTTGRNLVFTFGDFQMQYINRMRIIRGIV
jgi:hypothetical protein